MHGYWYNIATKKLYNIPDYFSPDQNNTTDWTGHNAWASVPGHAEKLGLTHKEGELLRTIRADVAGESDEGMAARHVIEKVWKNNIRVTVAYYPAGPTIYVQAWSLSQPGYVQVVQHILDVLTHYESFTINTTVSHANFQDYSMEDFDSTVGDVHKSHTIQELRKRGKHGGF